MKEEKKYYSAIQETETKLTIKTEDGLKERNFHSPEEMKEYIYLMNIKIKTQLG